jgi:hypothetical protein
MLRQSVANSTFRGIIFQLWFRILPPLIYKGDRLYLFLHFRNYQQVYTYPLFLFPTFSPQAYSSLERSGWRKFFTPCSLSFFFPMSAWGPTRWRNSTGLAELWGGWPIEQDSRIGGNYHGGALALRKYLA